MYVIFRNGDLIASHDLFSIAVRLAKVLALGPDDEEQVMTIVEVAG